MSFLDNVMVRKTEKRLNDAAEVEPSELRGDLDKRVSLKELEANIETAKDEAITETSYADKLKERKCDLRLRDVNFKEKGR